MLHEVRIKGKRNWNMLR